MLRLFLPALALFASCAQSPRPLENRSLSEAGESLNWWAKARMFPDGRFHTEKYAEGMAQLQLERRLRAQARSGGWEAIGPKNIGGRTLCLAVHPLDTNILYAGSASGGLWKSTTAGRGAAAWQYVDTGFPVLGVSAVAIDPKNPQVLYIGTGEVYNVENSMPNVALRVTRGTYGIGILKSSDGGAHWTKSLDWAYGDLRGVQDIKINPLRPATVYAATSEGLLRSYNGGVSWKTVHNRSMAVDIEISPADTGIIFVTHGSLNDDGISGVFRSKDGGNSFQKLTTGIATQYSGKTLLGICPGQPNTIYASVGNDFNQEGLYRSNNGGNTWTKVSTQNVSSYQGWYSHDVAVHPADPNIFVWTGIDLWKSIDGGPVVQKKTSWSAWYFGQVPAGGPEGPPNYVHADIHRAYWMEKDPDKVYVVTDGGIFVSYDQGETWEGRNGGYQTQQFYANLGNSTTNPLLAIGGMQDNATAIYTGDGAWTRVIGGDGECAAISPLDDQVMFGSSQYLSIRKSIDGGQSFYGITSGGMNNEDPCFNGPFEIAPSNPQIMYAGAQSLHRSDDQGDSWSISNPLVGDGDPILTIAVHPDNPEEVFCSTVPPDASNGARVFKLNTANGTSTEVQGLPNRFCMDITYNHQYPKTVYAVFGGFGGSHVWRSQNGGLLWVNIDNGLPDVPTNTILNDPEHPTHLYVGNDLGVWLSRDEGETWELFSGEVPGAMLVMHLSISADRKLRVATHGSGVWQAPLAEASGTGSPAAAQKIDLRISPNPARAQTTLQFNLAADAPRTSLRVVDAAGRVVFTPAEQFLAAGQHRIPLDCSRWPAGVYGVVLEGKNVQRVVRMFVVE